MSALAGRLNPKRVTWLRSDAVLAAFCVPARDRYQIVQELPASRMVMQDTGLGLERPEKFVCVQVTSRSRSREQKQAFYRILSENLKDAESVATTSWSPWSRMATKTGHLDMGARNP